MQVVRFIQQRSLTMHIIRSNIKKQDESITPLQPFHKA
jgi:hypothetical protein